MHCTILLGDSITDMRRCIGNKSLLFTSSQFLERKRQSAPILDVKGNFCLYYWHFIAPTISPEYCVPRKSHAPLPMEPLMRLL